MGEYVTLVRGTTYKGQLVGEAGPALLGLGSIEPGGGFRTGNYKTYGGECPAELMLFPGDIYASLKGATKDGKMIGSVARVPPSVESGRLTQDTVKLVFRQENPEDASFLYWVLRTPQYRAYCAGHATGSAVVALSRRDFLSYPVPPPTSQRRTIVTLLDALEEKVELNRRMNETLETMAQALFNSWFVDFGPVRAKAEGRDPGLPKPLADLFPARLVPSELGEIPEGWSVLPLDEIADYVNGAACQKFPPKPGRETLPVIKIRELNQGVSDQTDRVGVDFPDKHLASDGDVLFSWSGTLTCKVWTGGPGFVNQHVFKVLSDRFPRWFCLHWTNHHLDVFKGIAADKATTMGHIKRSHLTEALCAVPDVELLEAANGLIKPLDERLVDSELEMRTLGVLRDSLLPKLISGELRVEDAERFVERAT